LTLLTKLSTKVSSNICQEVRFCFFDLLSDVYNELLTCLSPLLQDTDGGVTAGVETSPGAQASSTKQWQESGLHKTGTGHTSNKPDVNIRDMNGRYY
jgi:hypothetical protein